MKTIWTNPVVPCAACDAAGFVLCTECKGVGMIQLAFKEKKGSGGVLSGEIPEGRLVTVHEPPAAPTQPAAPAAERTP